mmetsp:Transcript_14481/g.39649  ORF Transcript_14481/g.39649 Transcript_14481/m.39649 type:complete len:250 (+) Transcript_14481:485-1234(+)
MKIICSNSGRLILRARLSLASRMLIMDTSSASLITTPPRSAARWRSSIVIKVTELPSVKREKAQEMRVATMEQNSSNVMQPSWSSSKFFTSSTWSSLSCGTAMPNARNVRFTSAASTKPLPSGSNKRKSRLRACSLTLAFHGGGRFLDTFSLQLWNAAVRQSDSKSTCNSSAARMTRKRSSISAGFCWSCIQRAWKRSRKLNSALKISRYVVVSKSCGLKAEYCLSSVSLFVRSHESFSRSSSKSWRRS